VRSARRGGDRCAPRSARREDPKGRTLTLPDALRAEDFLVGNSGIQGSNLSARLSTLLEAGCFDEALLSCTDRDLCVRFAQIGAVYAAAKGGAAHHDTLHGGPRLSDPGSPAKIAGLNIFSTSMPGP
jgi:hypothetical protein